jgi:hypothetical protein
VHDAEEVHQRKESTIEMTQQRNEAVQQFNDIQQSLNEIARHKVGYTEDDEISHEDAVNKVTAKFETYKGGRNPNAKTITPGNVPFENCLEDLKSIPPQLVDSYIKCYESSQAPLPSHLKVTYRQIQRASDGKFVRVISAPKKV